MSNQPNKKTAKVLCSPAHTNAPPEWREVEVLHRPVTAPNIIVHKTQVSYGKFVGYSITAESCGLSYAQNIRRLDGAVAFADYLAGIPELAHIATTAHAHHIPPFIMGAMRKKLDDINGEFK